MRDDVLETFRRWCERNDVDTGRDLIAEVERLRSRLAEVEAERDAMRAVVDAAIDLNSIDDGTEPDGPHLFYAQCEAARLVMLAVDAYQAARPTLKATGEGE